MQASRTDRLKDPFVLTEADARKLDASMKRFSDEILYTVRCADGIDRKVGDIEALCDYDNPGRRSIEAIEIFARNATLDAWARVELANNEYETVRLHIEGPEPDVVALSDALQDRFLSMRPWYGRLARADFVMVLWALFAAFVVGIMAASAFGILGSTKSAPLEDDSRSEARRFLLGAILVAVPFAFGIALNRFRGHLFPMGTFALGQGAKRHSEKETWRIVVGVGFAVSTVSGIAVWLFSLAFR